MKKQAFAKTDVRYWKEKVFKRDRGGSVDRDFTVQVQFRGRREKLPLGTPNKEVAAKRACDIYSTLHAEGWKPVLQKWKPSHTTQEPSERPTVGDLFAAYESLSNVRPRTLAAYKKSFRMIVSRIARIESAEKYDACQGGAQRWQAEVDAVKLDTITPAKIEEWKVYAIKAAGKSPAKQCAAKTTVNSVIRSARSLFAKKRLRFIKERLILPTPLPFDDVALEKRQSAKYQSTIDATSLVASALTELSDRPEELKIFLLALMCGLRKAEIDGLEWSAFDFDNRVLRIRETEDLQLKSLESAAEIDLEPEFVGRFKELELRASGRFVIESRSTERTVRTERASLHFDRLNRWLRSHGVAAQKPLHELRKECGALVCARAGIYAASRFLRHRDITVTSQHYVDKKERITSGLGGLLEASRVATMDSSNVCGGA
ncbi:tyrosine-type recombinase/integrase [bacterium]|nr:tyrosine-type recombinase/integrase [bacterium]